MSKEPFHVAIFVPSEQGGGAQKVLVELANELPLHVLRTDVIVGIGDDGKKLREDRIEKLVRLKKSRMIFCIIPLARYLLREKPDVLISGLMYANVACFFAALVTKYGGGLVFREATTITNEKKRQSNAKDKFLYGILGRIYRKADKIVAVSKGVQLNLIEKYSLSKEKVTVIYNPVDQETLKVLAREGDCHPWLESKNRKVVVAIGRLTAAKNFTCLVEAFRRVLEEIDARLVIFGEGEERKNIQRLIEKYGLERKIDLAGFKENPYKDLARSDVFVLSSLWEGMPNVMLEAIALGVPVIATDCKSGPSEIVAETGCGKLVASGDPDDLGTAIVEQLKNNSDRVFPKNLSSVCNLKKFSKELVVKRYIEELTDLKVLKS